MANLRRAAVGTAILIAVAATSWEARAADPLDELGKQRVVITAARAPGPLPLAPDDTAWNGVESSEVTLYPQTSVTPGAGGDMRATIIKVSVLYGEADMAVRLEWPDATQSLARGVGVFPDAAAVQVPFTLDKRIALPYIGMGNPGAPVEINFWRASGTVETLHAEGFGSATVQQTQMAAAGQRWDGGSWRVVIKRPLDVVSAKAKSSLARLGLAPLSVAVWDGATGQRNGAKRLSSWIFVRFSGIALDERYASSLAWRPKGDPERGRAVMDEAGCAACHTYPGSPPQPGTAPDLTFAGGIHHPSYLRESITNPSAFIVPGAAYHTIEGKRKVSVMPVPGLTDAQIGQVVDFLLTLR